MSASKATIINETRLCHCLAARKRARELTRRYDAALRPHGIRATQFSVLAALTQSGPVPVTRLADILGLERTTLTRVAAVLERNGWLSAKKDSRDERSRVLAVTAPGKATFMKALPDWKALQDVISKA